MNCAIVYIRVSTDEQASSGLGMSAQRQNCESLAQRLGVEITAVHADEGVSGGASIEERPGLMAAIDALQPGDLLLAHKRDRVARDLVIAALVEKLVARRRARLVTTDAPDDDSPTAVLMKQILDAFGQFERALIRQRTKSAMAAARLKGRRVGHVPYGKRVASDGRHLEENPQEQAILQQIRRLRVRGATVLGICDTLNEKGHRNRAGQPFKSGHVAQLLERHGDGITLQSG
jgi:DNA invertase Pin-like site-specific DNA recombinase